MASTRNKNTPGDYKQEKSAYKKSCNYNTYASYGVPEQSYFPGLGIAGAKMATTELASNPYDIESTLFGIGSTNLETPTPEVLPDIKQHKTLNFGDRIPLFMPKPLTVDTTIQRPMYLS
jgi:hypothetical protein